MITTLFSPKIASLRKSVIFWRLYTEGRQSIKRLGLDTGFMVFDSTYVDICIIHT